MTTRVPRSKPDAARRASGKPALPANPSVVSQVDLAVLAELERKVLWLSTWMVHNANHIRPNIDGLKVGGHQASSASSVTLLTALYFHILNPADRIAIKPHSSPAYHAIQYLMGRQTREKLEQFRAMGGAQSYPSRTKDTVVVDFSGGSMGLPIGLTTFASLAQDYVRLKQLVPTGTPPGRMVALMGDAEFDEGNVFEAMLEGWKHDVRNLWWVIDYNRQSLDAVVTDRLFGRVDDIFRSTGWQVTVLKYGKKLQAAFAQPGGAALRQWIDDCPNSLYSALVYKGGASWREHLQQDLGTTPGIKALLAAHTDAALHALMTNLAGHDLEALLEGFGAADSDQPHCFIAYTIKGWGLPFAGHKDNHSGLMSVAQMTAFKQAQGIADGAEWDPLAGVRLPAERVQSYLRHVPYFSGSSQRPAAPTVAVPPTLAYQSAPSLSTQEGFGRILNELGRADGEFAARVVTVSPDVTVSTNLGPWVNRRGIFDRRERADTFKAEQIISAQRWQVSPAGQHIELGIAENNLFLALAAFGLAGPLFGCRLLPVGTLYDPFIMRGLDALNYAAYQDARFMLVATPSGISLAAEGGAHQSISTPLIGMGQDKLASFDPAFVDELAVIMQWGFEHMQAEDGGSLYLRLSTRSLLQPVREMDASVKSGILCGAYWQRLPAAGCPLVIAYCGVVAPEAMAAHQQLLEDVPGAGLLAVTSPDRLFGNWSATVQARTRGANPPLAHIEMLLAPLAAQATLVTVLDAHPATLSWLGSVARHRVYPLGVDHFGQCGSLPDLYRVHGIDTAAILDACAAACLSR